MATYYVSSVSGDNSTGLSWATAKTSIAAALALATANGDIIFVDSAHVFTSGAAISWDIPTTNTHVSVISVNRNGSTTTGHSGRQTGAKETVGVNAAAFNICAVSAINQSFYCFGVYIEGNNGAGANTINIAPAAGGMSNIELDTCTLSTPGTGGSADIVLGSSIGTRRSRILLRNCHSIGKNSNAATSAVFQLNIADVFISNLTFAYAGANKPTAMFKWSTGGGWFEIVDSDLSTYNTNAYVQVTNMISPVEAVLRNCRLHATPTHTTGTFPSNALASVLFDNCDSGDTKSKFAYYTRQGTLLSTESIYANDGGVIDSLNVGWQIVTTSDCSEAFPFTTPWFYRRTTQTTSMNVGFRIAHDSATDLTDRNLWPEVSYVSDANFPKGTLQTGRNTSPHEGTGIDWPNNSDAWTGIGGFTNPNKQTVTVSLTPAEANTLRGRLNVGIASKTLYVDPLLRVS